MYSAYIPSPETVVDAKFDPFPESAFVSEMMKTLEQMLKDISNPDLKERAKHTAFDYFELQAQEVLNKKNKENKTQESYNSKSLLDRIYEAAEEGAGLGSGDDSQNQEQNNNSQNQEQNQNQDQNQEKTQNKDNEEEAKKREEKKKKWQKVQQWYQDNKGCRWVAKLLSVIYSNWKNQGVYKEKGIDDQIHKDGIINIDKTAIKKSKTKVETIKLDSNFDLRIYGGQDRIIKGYDEDAGLSYYQLYFEEER